MVMVIDDWTTMLFVPGDRPDRFKKAAASGADAIIIDFEDAVSPTRKNLARHGLNSIRDLTDSPPIVVRINAIGTPWHRDDISALGVLPLAAIMLPKAESSADIGKISEAVGGIPVIALVESPRGIAETRAIASGGHVARLAFGSVDFSAAVGCAHSREALLHARSELVLGSALVGLPPPIDGVTISTKDNEACEGDARYAANLGFGGKLCIHPAQIVPARRGFAPTAEEVAWAQAVLDSADDGAVAFAGVMIDAPVRAQARRIIRRSERAD